MLPSLALALPWPVLAHGSAPHAAAPSMAHVPPGRTQRLTWRLTEPGGFLAGCLVAGHWDAGMRATITVKE